jgi:hypothetical protein
MLLEVLLDEHQQEAIASDSAVQSGYAAWFISRITGPVPHTFWTGYWIAAGG